MMKEEVMMLFLYQPPRRALHTIM